MEREQSKLSFLKDAQRANNSNAPSGSSRTHRQPGRRKQGRKLLEFTEVDSCQRQGKWIGEEQDGIIVLVVSFVLEERIDRRVFW